MNDAEKFTAVCGQRCGTVDVPAADTTNCPQCGHPLTTLPQAPLTGDLGGPTTASPAPAVDTAGAKRIGGEIGAGPLPTSAQPTSASVLTPEEEIADALMKAGYAAEEAASMAKSAVDQLAARLADAAEAADHDHGK